MEVKDDYNHASRYKLVRKHLDVLGYKQSLSIDTLPLVETLLADLIQTTDSLNHFKTIAQECIESSLPDAPIAIEIYRSAEGVQLSWESPSNAGPILEYSVYLRMRIKSQATNDGESTPATPASQTAFIRVYCGPTNSCIVPLSLLNAAYVDPTTKPAIVFRVVARNGKGYGPTAQVMWLQESATSVKSDPTMKRPMKQQLPSPLKKVKSEPVTLEFQ